MSPNRFEATTTSKRSGLRTKCAHRMSMWNWSVRMSRVLLRHRVEALVPVRHRDRDAVRFGRGGHVLRRAPSRELERELHDPVDALAREHRFLEHDFALGAFEHPAAHRRILAFGVLADDDEIDVARLAIRERRRDSRHQTARPQVHVLVEAAPELDQRSPKRDMVGHGRRPADGAVEDRVVRAENVEPVLGHHAAVLRVVIAIPVELLPIECDAELAPGGLENGHALRHRFLADTVPGDDGDAMRFHCWTPIFGISIAEIRF